MLRRVLPLLLVAVVNVVACGPEDNGSVCPFCVPQAGGETSDFGGLQSSCTGMPQPLTAELAQQYDVDAVRARVEGPFEAGLRWTLNPYTVENLAGSSYARLPSGYDALTRVEGHVTLEPPVFYDGYAHEPSVESCPDWVELPAQVNVTTADGALMTPTMTGALRIREDQLVPMLFASVDIVEVQGRLDLHAKPTGNPRGNLWVSINVFPEGLRGELMPVLNRDIEVISGQWPADDGCDEKAFPIDLDSPHAWFAGRTARDEFIQWQADIAGHAPAVGRWLDRSEVTVEVALDAPSQKACLGAIANEVSVEMLGDLGRLTTSDGRVNAPLSRGLFLPSRFLLGRPGPRLMPAEFEARTGIRGIDAFGSPWLSALVETTYVRTATGITADGTLQVEGQPRCAKPDGSCASDPRVDGTAIDCLNWPPRDFSEYCGRHLR